MAEDGREYYAVSKEFDLRNVHRWLWRNVMPHLPPFSDPSWRSREEILEDIVDFCDKDLYGWPEFWAYYAAFDWIAFCWIFGPMGLMPHGWPQYCLDIKQLAVSRGNPDLPEQPGKQHDALADARWNKQVWEYLMPLREGRE